MCPLIRFNANVKEPQEKTRPTCKVEDHTWVIEIEAGQVHLRCEDPHSDEEIAEMGYTPTPGCLVGAEELSLELGPLKLKWECESHGWEYPRDYDCWLALDDGKTT